MDYQAALDAALTRLHDEGRYRTFIDIERRKGQFPKAVWTRPDGSEKEITVWCGNDYLGMGQHPVVLAAMHEALDATGAGSGGIASVSTGITLGGGKVNLITGDDSAPRTTHPGCAAITNASKSLLRCTRSR